MQNDVAVLITRAEARGAAFRVREGQVEVRGLECLPEELADELRVHKSDVLKHLTSQEKQTTSEENAHLLAWASELAEQEVVLTEPVSYIEAPLRQVSTQRVSWYAAHYLHAITSARIGQEAGGWGRYDSRWHRRCEEEAMGALSALRQALAQRETAEESQA